MNPIFANSPTTVFETMSRLAHQYAAINLGQGFPDDPGPQDVRAMAAEAVLHGSNQYPPMMGLPELREAVAAHYARFQSLDLDWASEILITSGATEALAATLLAVTEPGDEILLLQPLYDAYLPLVRRANGVPRFVTLHPPDWRVGEEALRGAISPRTRAIVVNTPHNPAARALDGEEIALIARLCVEYNLIAISDEVWEHVLFDGISHLGLMNVPVMRERTVKIGSAGKIFSLTGWKVGFVAASPHLLQSIAKAHQYLTFTTPPNLQAAVAYGLRKEAEYFTRTREQFQNSRDRFRVGLESMGFKVLPCTATYFLNIDLAASGFSEGDVAFCHRLVEHHGVAAIPVSAFYAERPATHVVRFCFAKHDERLDEALRRLSSLKIRPTG